MDANGRNQTRLTHNAADDYSPVWSPDGKQIAFESNRDGTSNIHVMDTAGGNVEQITHLKFASSPKWAPDSKWIAFDWGADPPGIYAIEPDCRISRPVFNRPMFFDVPMFVAGWSPDGS